MASDRTRVATGTAFDRLSPALRYHVVNSLGFSELRPVQELAIEAILDGANCVVLAPTAGGKTEAAFFPLLSRMDADAWQTPSVLYLSPIKALLNNQAARLERYAGLIGRRVFRWHGDIGQSHRKRFLREPSDILMTTPESLEVMLMSQRVSRSLFANLQAVVIDEVHAFAGDDRGAHLVSLLERLSRVCGRDVQRIGLSATVGNPDEILRWLGGSSKRAGRLVDPPKALNAPEVHLDYVGTLENAARVVAGMNRGGKRLVFVDSRRRVEKLAVALKGLGVETYVTHSSLSADERHRAEQAFESGENCVIAATSTMELGIDVGDLDAVFQVDAPPSVASFLQRMGRTGRRPGTRQNCTVLCTDADSLAISAALLRLWSHGYVEPVTPEPDAYHVLAQQLMALSVQEQGIPTTDWWAWVSGAASYEAVNDEDRAALVRKMIAEDILHETDGRLWLGERGEKLYGRRHFEPLFAVFDTPRIIHVLWGADEIGQVDSQFMQALRENPVFVLGGRSWQVEHVDWDRGRCQVSPAKSGRYLSWYGAPRLLSRLVSQAVRELIVTDDVDAWWTERARDELAAYRENYAFCRELESPVYQKGDDLVWHTYLGGRVNNLLARLLEERLGKAVIPDNFTITLRGEAAQSLAALNEARADLMKPGAVTEADALRHAESCVRGRLSKFQPCLPEELELRFLARRVVELPVDVTGLGQRRAR